MCVSVDDPEKDHTEIIQKFMKQLCRRDDEDNRGLNHDPNRANNIFPVEQIQSAALNPYELERVILSLRRYILENRDNEPLEFLDNETNVRLTNAGRARCDEYGL
jgi:hypothetical protein